jgi:hypothetical protein
LVTNGRDATESTTAFISFTSIWVAATSGARRMTDSGSGLPGTPYPWASSEAAESRTRSFEVSRLSAPARNTVPTPWTSTKGGIVVKNGMLVTSGR